MSVQSNARSMHEGRAVRPQRQNAPRQTTTATAIDNRRHAAALPHRSTP
jgi:hypothetical protein